jgi:hypothetical protein
LPQGVAATRGALGRGGEVVGRARRRRLGHLKRLRRTGGAGSGARTRRRSIPVELGPAGIVAHPVWASAFTCSGSRDVQEIQACHWLDLA